ncbi:M48 family metalloprotease [Dactylosporangium sp. CA-139114]|uniref:M48 family metallopeptidase n=1 Tax=Dactylosporangium sp. CA-139114 TaxID=3239931 RepID=UPI003D96B53E
MNRVAGRAARRALARDERLAAELAGHVAGPPGWGPARVVVTLMAILIQLAAIAALGGGAWLVVRDFPSITVLPGVVLLAFGAVLLPRPAGLPRYSTRLDRADAPHLHAFVAEVAAAVGTRCPRIIVVDDSFEADGGTTGLLRRRYLRIGVPLFAVLTPLQRTALVAHQLAHFTNGDPLRSGPAGSVDRSLTALVALFEPRRDTSVRALQDPAILGAMAGAGGGPMRAGVGTVWYAELILGPVNAVLRWIAAGGRLLFASAARADVHRAEYRADAEAARVAGSAATLAMLDTLGLREPMVTVLRRHIRQAGDDRPDLTAWRALGDDVRAHAPAEPPLSASWFAGHPPLALRVRLVRSRPALEPALADACGTGVDADLATEYRRLARDLRYG